MVCDEFVLVCVEFVMICNGFMRFGMLLLWYIREFVIFAKHLLWFVMNLLWFVMNLRYLLGICCDSLWVCGGFYYGFMIFARHFVVVYCICCDLYLFFYICSHLLWFVVNFDIWYAFVMVCIDFSDCFGFAFALVWACCVFYGFAIFARHLLWFVMNSLWFLVALLYLLGIGCDLWRLCNARDGFVIFAKHFLLYVMDLWYLLDICDL